MPTDRPLQPKKRKRSAAASDPAFAVGVSKATPITEQIGHYDPKKNPADVKIDRARVDYWVSKGAQLSPTVKHLLRKFGDATGDEVQQPKGLLGLIRTPNTEDEVQHGARVVSVLHATEEVNSLLTKQMRGFEQALARRLKRWERLLRAAEKVGD